MTRVHVHPDTGREISIRLFRRAYSVAINHRGAYHLAGGFAHPEWGTYVHETGVTDGLVVATRREIVSWAATLPADSLPKDDGTTQARPTPRENFTTTFYQEHGR